MRDLQQAETHIVVVAKQGVPNLSPILDCSMNVKKVILIFSDFFNKEASWLESVYIRYGLKVEKWQISDVFDYSGLISELKPKFISLLKQEKIKPAVSLTIGTKPLGFVLLDLARELDLIAYYLQIDDSLSLINPVSNKRFSLGEKSKIQDVLQVHGFLVEDEISGALKKNIVTLLKGISDKVATFYNDFTTMASLAKSSHSPSFISNRVNKSDKGLQLLLELYVESGLISYTSSNKSRLNFKNEKIKFFVKGGWLEMLIHWHLKEIMREDSRLQDCRMGIKLRNQSTDVVNEIDNLALYNNNLFVIECKTGRGQGTAVNAIYKLETIMGELGGQLAKGLLVSLKPVSEYDFKRAKQYNIEILEMTRVNDLREFLKTWLSSKLSF